MLINHRYQVIRTLGEGGFGYAYLAEDTQMPSSRRCVIKQLKPVVTTAEVYQVVQERFQREAAILEKLGEDHQQIPRLFAYFSEGQPPDRKFSLVQEWIEGETLEAIVAANGPLGEAQVHSILGSLLPVLAFIHSQGIIHRDLKPDNIMLRAGTQQPVLIDFGAVRETMGTVFNSRNHPTSSIVIGTPGYMPSEQAAGRPLPSSDLYSLGLTAVYLLTGKSPQALSSDPQSGEIIWRHEVAHVSAELVAVIDQAVQSHPRDRYSSAPQMLAALLGEESAQSATSAVNQPITFPHSASHLKTMAVSPGLTPSTQSQVSTYQQPLETAANSEFGNTVVAAGTNHSFAHSITQSITQSNAQANTQSNTQSSTQKKLLSFTPSFTPVTMGLIAAAVGGTLIGGGLLISRSMGDKTTLQPLVSQSKTDKKDSKSEKDPKADDATSAATDDAKSIDEADSALASDDSDLPADEPTAADVVPVAVSNTPQTSGSPARLRQDLGAERINVFRNPTKNRLVLRLSP
ncbi:MAG: serine/threonine protein kinase [Phormidesmis priestleyi]|uniref:non-specific serine/threonine protein kinase n=1 Tax=Phormidesmis priestleyi TaxID=268141 RepID=A0A2W4Z7I0_9CYAN|nr:MAG: serine/threonine protein kinase [Phormidesmis priestleyi]